MIVLRNWKLTVKKGIMCVCFFITIALLGFNTLSGVKLNNSVSFRFNQPISSTSAVQLREMCNENPERYNFWPIFWSQKHEQLKVDYSLQNANCYYIWGDCQTIFPVDFISGGYPSEVQHSSMSISNSLAWSFFGSIDVIGLKIIKEGKPYKISGIFTGDSNIAIIQENEKYSSTWQAVDMVLSNSNTSVNEAQDLLENALSQTPDNVISNHLVNTLFKISFFAPFGILLLMLFFKVLRFCKYKRQIIVSLLILIACALPFLLTFYVPFLTPTRWSDFEFYNRLHIALKEQAFNYLTFNPLHKDLLVKLSLIKQAFLLFTVIIVEIILYYNLASENVTKKLAFYNKLDL